MEFNNIRKALLPLKRLIYINSIIKAISTTSLIGGGVCALLSLIPFMFPIIFNFQRIILVFLISLISGCILFLFYIPREDEIIRTADSLGLQEQVLSAYEFRDNFSPICIALKEKAYRAVAGHNFNKGYSLKINFKILITILILYLLSVVTTFIPTDFKNKTIEFEKLKNELLAKVEEVSVEKIKKDGSLKKEEKEALLNELKSLSKELEDAKEIQDLQKSAKRFENSLEQQDSLAQSMELKKIAEILNKFQGTKDIAKDLKDGNAENLKKDLEWLGEKLKNMDAKDKKELAEQLQKLSKEMEGNKELTEAMNELSKKLESESSDLAQSTRNLSEKLTKLADSGGQLKKFINQYKKTLANNMNQSLANNLKNGTRNNDDRNEEYSIGSSSDPGNGESILGEDDNPGKQSKGANFEGQKSQGPGENSKGNDSNNGSGNGNNGSGKAGGSSQQEGNRGGGGVGKGSSNKDAGINQMGSGNGSRMPGEGNVKDFESIYSSKFLGGDSQSSTVKGQKNNSGFSTFNEGEGVVQKGEEISFEQVYGQYREEAMKSLNSSQIPPQYKDRVRDYFTAIDEVSN